MKIALASESAKKVAAIRLAFGEAAEIVTFKAPSGVNEQPIDDETLRGAKNRIDFIKAACPDADIFVSIENGLFLEDGEYVDRAVVTIAKADGEPSTTFSDGVIFPKDSVLKTERREGGFAEWTVGKTMMEDGIVTDDADPHADLDPDHRSRVDFLNEAAQKAAASLKL
jgi:non-canonical (house-cleaning) NTP pyrophosphatase